VSKKFHPVATLEYRTRKNQREIPEVTMNCFLIMWLLLCIYSLGGLNSELQAYYKGALTAWATLPVPWCAFEFRSWELFSQAGLLSSWDYRHEPPVPSTSVFSGVQGDCKHYLNASFSEADRSSQIFFMYSSYRLTPANAKTKTLSIKPHVINIKPEFLAQSPNSWDFMCQV
jgi:hypothetical protein